MSTGCSDGSRELPPLHSRHSRRKTLFQIHLRMFKTRKTFAFSKKKEREHLLSLHFLVVSHDSIRGCVRTSVRRSVGRLVGPQPLFFWRAETSRQTTYFVYTNLFIQHQNSKDKNYEKLNILAF